MISKSEILELATQASLQAHVIEKDYVLGWPIATQFRISARYVHRNRGVDLRGKRYRDTGG